VAAEDARRPICTIIGGPNGSGKSSIYPRLLPPGRFLNADVVARDMNPDHPEAVSLSAGRHILIELARAIEVRETFVYETTLSSNQSIELMRRAKQAGYEVGLVFVGLDGADLNVRRVANRVMRGGHDIPEDIIRRRYEAALRRLPDAIRIADGTMIFDNSATDGPHLLVRIRAGNVEAKYLDDTNVFHRRLDEAVAKALSPFPDAENSETTGSPPGFG
jgi:predicted ABC-type ATPase